MLNDRDCHVCLLDGENISQHIKINRKHKFRCFTDDCRILRFKSSMEGHSLQGHVLKTFTVQKKSTCEIRCFAEHSCMSYNIGPTHEDGSYVCELSNSDHKMHPEALGHRNGFTYRATEVIRLITAIKCSNSKKKKQTNAFPQLLQHFWQQERI